MIPDFESGGNLPPGVHWATWNEIVDRFGITEWRRELLDGFFSALDGLKRAGCRTVYLDGSFVTSKELPRDFDACWDEVGVDVELIDPILLEFDRGRAAQKEKYRGEFIPASWTARMRGGLSLKCSQPARETGQPKGIVALDLGGIE